VSSGGIVTSCKLSEVLNIVWRIQSVKNKEKARLQFFTFGLKRKTGKVASLKMKDGCLSLRFAIGFELDNAEAIDDIELILASYDSLLASTNLFLEQEPESKCLVALVHSDKLGPALRTKLTGVQSNYTHLDYTVVANTSGSYFGAKNASAGLAEHADLVIFCDSDCIYEVDFVTKILAGFQDPEVDVVFGETYPLLSDASGFQKRAALWWLFPPRTIGYGAVWKKSQWLNNMAARSKLLSHKPFPEVTVVHGRQSQSHQIKVEGVLWKQELQREGVRFGSVEATSEHRIFSTWAEFNDRQFSMV
jgi:hypothetical protein